MWKPICAAQGSTRGRICRSISPTTSSASRPSSRASSGACATAPRPVRTRPPWRRWCARSPPGRGSSRARRARDEQELRARSWRRRGARDCSHRGARGDRRDGPQARRHCRHIDWIARRRRLCGRHVGPRDPALRHRPRPRSYGRAPAAHCDSCLHVRQSLQYRLRQRDLGRCGEILRAVPARQSAGRVRGAQDPAHHRRHRSLPAQAGGIFVRRAQARARGFDRAADADAPGRDRGPGADRWWGDQPAAVRPPVRSGRRGGGDRYFRRADRRAARHPESLGMPDHNGAGDGQRHHRGEGQAQRARPHRAAQGRHVPHDGFSAGKRHPARCRSDQGRAEGKAEGAAVEVGSGGATACPS